MKTYNVYVQDKFYKTVEAEFMNEILTKVVEDISNNLVPDYDINLPSSIKIQPA